MTSLLRNSLPTLLAARSITTRLASSAMELQSSGGGLVCSRRALFVTSAPLRKAMTAFVSSGPPTSATARRRMRGRTSWTLPDVRLPGGHRRTAKSLADLEQLLGRPSSRSRTAQLVSSPASAAPNANRAGRLALMRKAMQDPLFTPPHREPEKEGTGGLSAHLQSRPGRRSGASNPRRTWHMQPTEERRWRAKGATQGARRDTMYKGKLNTQAFRQWYNEA